MTPFVLEIFQSLNSVNWRIANWDLTLKVFHDLCEFCFLSSANWRTANQTQSLLPLSLKYLCL